jgi:hypothetical protein
LRKTFLAEDRRKGKIGSLPARAGDSITGQRQIGTQLTSARVARHYNHMNVIFKDRSAYLNEYSIRAQRREIWLMEVHHEYGFSPPSRK